MGYDMLLVKENLTEDDKLKLERMGFVNTVDITWYKDFGENFSIILTYEGRKIRKGRLSINYLDENIEDNYVDNTIDASEIYEEIALLIANGIVLKEE